MLNLFLCGIRGHKWKAIHDFNLDSGHLQSVTIECSHCRTSAGKHYVQHALDYEELLQHRQAWQDFADGLSRINQLLDANSR